MVETTAIEQEAQSKKGSKTKGEAKNLVSEAMKSRAAMMTEQYNLPDNYKILVNSPLAELDSPYGRAFDVSDSNQGGSYYAVILPNSVPIRFAVIQKLKSIYQIGFCNIVDSGFVDISNGQFGNFAVIVERPMGATLNTLIEETKKTRPEIAKKEWYFDDDFITHKIVKPIVDVIKAFQDNGVSHGLINIDNVYYQPLEGGLGKIYLKEPVSEPCGFSQKHQYEPMHRAQAMLLGKGEATIKDDFFALGVLVFNMLFGRMPGDNLDQQSLTSIRLERGSYITYLAKDDVSPRMADLLKGLLNDIPEDRWGVNNLRDWIKGKRFNLIKPTMRKESIRSYEFKGMGHNNSRSLANTYQQNWVIAAENIRSGKLTKWLELSVNKSISADDINTVMLGTGEEKAKSKREDDELISKTLTILDPVAPIRYKDMAIHLDGLGAVLANAWAQQNQGEIKTFTEILRVNLADFKAQRDIFNEKVPDRWLLQKLHNFITIRSYGFGVERCLYDLNEAYPCQSMMTKSSFVIHIKQLVFFLNDNASKFKDRDPVDRHIAAFITSKLDITKEIKLDAASRFRDKDIKDIILKIALLSYAQAKAESPKLAGLCSWIVSYMGPIVASIKSDKIKKEFKKDLDRVADTGSIKGILDLLTEGRHFNEDRIGYAQAKSEYLLLNNQMRVLTDPLQRKKRGNLYYFNGLYVAKVISVLVFIFILSMTLF